MMTLLPNTMSPTLLVDASTHRTNSDYRRQALFHMLQILIKMIVGT
jgi:hypothetical protein